MSMRKVSLVVLALATVLLLTPMPVSADTIGSWRFEEGQPGQAATGSGAILDSSGNGLNGTPFLSPIYRSVSNPSSTLGLQFTGGNQRVFVPDNNLFALTHSLTLEAFIRFDDTPPNTQNQLQIVFRGDDRAALDPYCLYLDLTGHLVFQVENASGLKGSLTSPTPIPVGTFIHVAGTLDDSTGQQKLFIDGSEIASQVTTVRPFGSLNSGLTPGLGIGNLQSTLLRESFGGIIDDVRISNVALHPSQFLNVPEPGSLALLAAAAVGGLFFWRRRRGGLCESALNLDAHSQRKAKLMNTTTNIVSRLILAAVVCTALASNALAVNYTITNLGTLGGSEADTEAHDINDLGQVVGSSYTGEGYATKRAYLWQNGVMTNLGSLGTYISSAWAINNAGQIVGETDTPVDERHAFLYSGGVMSELGTLGGNYSFAYSINASGKIVGGSRHQQGSTSIHPILYSGGVMQDLGTLGGPGGRAYVIGNDDAIVGRSVISDGSTYHAFYKPASGPMQDLHSYLSALGDESYALAYAPGWAIGGNASSTTEEISRAFIIDIRDGISNAVAIDLGPSPFGGTLHSVADINDRGDVLVMGSTAADDYLYNSYIYSLADGTTTLLDSLLPAGSGWSNLDGAAINNLGQIVGQGYYNGELRAFVMSPVPEPSTFVLLAVAAVGGLFFWRRQRPG